MSSSGSGLPLRYRRLGHAEFGLVDRLDVEPVACFLEPIPVILGFVHRGPAHALFAIEQGNACLGFYVVHPDRRDQACWWLGWLAIDRSAQGRGIGRATMAAVLAGLRRVAGCRRVRLLVAPDNIAALRLYRAAGFKPIDTWPGTGEWVMERTQSLGIPAGERLDLVANAYTMLQAMWLRLWRRGAPPAARLSGEFHGPPGLTRLSLAAN